MTTNHKQQQKSSVVLAIILFVIFVIAMCSGCSTTVPVTAKFPDVPERLLVKCPQLEKLENEAKLSDISKKIANNYTTYYDCAVKHDAFVEWYQIQKHIFQGVK
jgi:hypothetical protein